MRSSHETNERLLARLRDLRAVREELGLQMHLLRMEGRTAWDKVAARLAGARVEIDMRALRELRKLRHLWPRRAARS